MDLETGEQLIFVGHPSWRSILGFYFKGLVLAIVVAGIVLVATDTGPAVGAGIALLVVVLVAGYVKRLFTTYTITDHRLHIRRGIVSRAEQQTLVNRVQNVNTHQSVIQRMLVIGTVDFDTAAGDDFDFKFVGINDPAGLARQIAELQREAMQGHSSPQAQHGV
jgi:uncharacterized membrane protein YdbT with pleckstrin-like domain